MKPDPSTTETLEVRVHYPDREPTLIYLPGLHGDWTLVGAFRRELKGRARFVEVTYPRTLTWSLEDYAEAVEEALERNGIDRGWVLAESFGSQVLWPLARRRKFALQGVVLAGGFVQHPVRWAVRLAERVTGGISLTLLTRILFGYARIARYRFRHSPEVVGGIEEFLARRTEQDRQAAKHRLRLITRNDACAAASGIHVPVYGLTGLIDPVVPWVFVRPWLRRNCPTLKEYRIIAWADHNVLGTAPRQAADQVVRWITS